MNASLMLTDCKFGGMLILMIRLQKPVEPVTGGIPAGFLFCFDNVMR